MCRITHFRSNGGDAVVVANINGSPNHVHMLIGGYVCTGCEWMNPRSVCVYRGCTEGVVVVKSAAKEINPFKANQSNGISFNNNSQEAFALALI